MSAFDQTIKLIEQKPTDIWGLAYEPSLVTGYDNDQDPPIFQDYGGQEVSDCNLSVLRSVVAELGNKLTACFEIGVHRNEAGSFTNIMLENRPAGSFYLGVDLDDKSYLNDPTTNTWTIATNSHDQDKIRKFLAEHGIEKLDLLFIDGKHSVNTVVNDWRYADMLSDHGIVICHDTSAHPGCVALVEAVDKKLFDVQRLCHSDNGIAVFRRKPA